MGKKYVLTGGPSCGKTTLLLALKEKGFNVIKEAAEDVIKGYLEKGVKEPWKDLKKFQDEILKLQLEREGEFSKIEGPVVLDRGSLDGYAYYLTSGVEPSSLMLNEIERKKKDKDYDTVFLIEHLDFFEDSDVRRENLEEAIKIENALEKIYADLGYNVIRIKSKSVKERVKEILAVIENGTSD